MRRYRYLARLVLSEVCTGRTNIGYTTAEHAAKQMNSDVAARQNHEIAHRPNTLHDTKAEPREAPNLAPLRRARWVRSRLLGRYSYMEEYLRTAARQHQDLCLKVTGKTSKLNSAVALFFILIALSTTGHQPISARHGGDMPVLQTHTHLPRTIR